MNFGKSLFIGLLIAALVVFAIDGAMLDTGNNGEFVDMQTGERTPHYYQVIGIWFAIVAMPITLISTAIGYLMRKSD